MFELRWIETTEFIPELKEHKKLLQVRHAVHIDTIIDFDEATNIPGWVWTEWQDIPVVPIEVSN